MRESVVTSPAAPALLWNTLNTSYADPPKLRQHEYFGHEIDCGAVLLLSARQAGAAT
jgi:hypothetical protein